MVPAVAVAAGSFRKDNQHSTCWDLGEVGHTHMIHIPVYIHNIHHSTGSDLVETEQIQQMDPESFIRFMKSVNL